MKLILILAGIYTNKIVAFGAQKTHRHTLKSQLTHNNAIIEPFFFENEQGEAVTVNGNGCPAMLNECLFTKIEEEDIGNIWFQQNGAKWHIAEATLDVLSTVLEDRIISRRAGVVWPPRNCDLTPWDYYFWGNVKDKCYADKLEKKGQYSWNHHWWNTAAHNR